MGGCGATLIGPDVILGAAHCGSAVGRIVAIGGGSMRGEIVLEQRHPGYNINTQENDFYLYKLRLPVSTTGARVTVNTNGSAPSVGQALNVIGYGFTSEGGSVSDKMRDVVVPSVSNTYCQSVYGSSINPNVMFCAGGEGGKDSCQGDSGGPIVIRNGNDHVLTGLVSFGYGCARPGYPGVYARVSAVTSWISSVACNEWRSSVNGLCSGASPVLAPIAAPTPASIVQPPAPTPRPAPAPTTSGGSCTKLSVELRTDNWPGENIIILSNTRQTLWNQNGFQANKYYRFTRCVPNNGCTMLDVTDTYGDGLDGNAYMKITVGSRVVYNGQDLGYGFLMNIGNSC